MAKCKQYHLQTCKISEQIIVLTIIYFTSTHFHLTRDNRMNIQTALTASKKHRQYATALGIGTVKVKFIYNRQTSYQVETDQHTVISWQKCTYIQHL